jgi:hypothetical protein
MYLRKENNSSGFYMVGSDHSLSNLVTFPHIVQCGKNKNFLNIQFSIYFN